MNENDYKKEMTNIGKEFARLFFEFGGRVVIRQGVVSAVYLDDAQSPHEPYTMDVRMTNGAEVLGIVLGIVDNGNMGVLFIPQVGARVMLAVPDGEASSMFPICYDKIEQTVITYALGEDADQISANADGITINRGDYTCNITKENISLSCAGGASFEIADDTITMNGGQLNGLVKLQELQNNLNSIKSYCDQLNMAISAGFAAAMPNPAQAPNTPSSAFATSMAGVAIILQDMENKKIVQ